MVYSQNDEPLYREKPIEILYHLKNDPGEVVDLANNPEFASVKAEMNQALHDWFEETGGWKGVPVLKH